MKIKILLSEILFYISWIQNYIQRPWSEGSRIQHLSGATSRPRHGAPWMWRSVQMRFLWGIPRQRTGMRAYSIMWNSGSEQRMAGSRGDWRVRTPHENIEDAGILKVYCRLGLLWAKRRDGRDHRMVVNLLFLNLNRSLSWYRFRHRSLVFAN